MDRCGLGSADFNRHVKQQGLPHSVQMHVVLRNQAGDELVTFDQGGGHERNVVVTDGSITVDATTLVGRILSLTVADPYQELLVGQDANYLDRQLQVSVGIPNEELGKVVWSDRFTGPIVAAPRSGDQIVFTAYGKAWYAMHGIQPKYTVPKGTRVTTAIKRILNELAGEPMGTMGDVPDLTPKLKKDLVMDLADHPWAVCRNLANSMARHLQFDGGGQLRMQRIDLTKPVFTYHGTDEPGTRLIVGEPPEAWTDWSTVRNIVRVTGGATGTSDPPVYIADADDYYPNNPFSPSKLGRNGAAAYRWHFIVNEHLHTQATVKRVAEQNLARDMTANREYKWDSIPLYLFDEMDLIGIDVKEFTGQTHLEKWVEPLLMEGSPSMSMGYTGRRSSNIFARRRNG